MLLDRYKGLSTRFYDEDRVLYLKRATWTQVLSLIGTGTFYGAYALMALMTAAGKLTLGNMTLYVVAFRQGQQAFQSSLAAIGGMYEHNLYMSNLWEYLGITGASAGARVSSDADVSSGAGMSAGIVFDDVGFRYPGKDLWALRHVNLAITKGESLALVGENGAGKTTLVKLLTRLYEPTEGRILLDGRDLRDYGDLELRRRFGVLFQDFNQYQLKVRENVGLGSVEHIEDTSRIERAVEMGGAAEVVSALAGGLEAPLGRWFQNGTELSGGQWQKIALARAFMREDADVLVLDEPTAALDAEAEHAVFERFRVLAQGRTTIVISHRFPTVRMARKIVVLDHGGIAESGTHDELVAKGGKYARMFALQAEGYR
ncbi:MAG: ABC transporter ATP-binding protein [Polyangiaceae bacterium]